MNFVEQRLAGLLMTPDKYSRENLHKVKNVLCFIRDCVIVEDAERAEKFLAEFDGQLIIPEFANRGESDQFQYDIPEWEYYGLQNSHVIVFWIPRTRELIGLTTNHEHGYWMATEREKIVYGRPDDAYCIKYLDIMWAADAKRRTKETGVYLGRRRKPTLFRGWVVHYPRPIYNTLEKTVNAALKHFTPWSFHETAKE